MEEFEGRRRGMLTTREWCNAVSNMLHHVQKGLSGQWGIGHRGLRMVSDSFLCRHSGLFSLDCEGYTGGQRIPSTL